MGQLRIFCRRAWKFIVRDLGVCTVCLLVESEEGSGVQVHPAIPRHSFSDPVGRSVWSRRVSLQE